MSNLLSIRAAADEAGDAIALCCGGRAHSFAELAARIDAAAAAAIETLTAARRAELPAVVLAGEAQRHLTLARENSTTRQDRELYAAKLQRIKSGTH